MRERNKCHSEPRRRRGIPSVIAKGVPRFARDDGYSLVEVLIAMAITSIVLLTVVTLFYMGRRNVYSGKQLTYAVSVGTRMLEDLSTMATSDLVGGGSTGAQSYFNIDDSTTLGTVTVEGIAPGAGATGLQTFSDSIQRETTTCTATPPYTCPDDTPTGGFTCPDDPTVGPKKPCYMARWRALIDESKLTNARAGLILTPRWVAGQANPALSNTTYLKIRAYVSWDEAKNRRRIAFFDTAKVNRQ